MFGLFKKKPTAEERAQALFMTLRPRWFDVIEAVELIDGKFSKHHEAGLFVGVVALFELMKHTDAETQAFAEEFGLFWVVFIAGNPNEVACPDAASLSLLLEERYASYKPLLLSVFDVHAADPAKSPEVQLTWELFTRCTDKAAPANFLELMSVAVPLLEVVFEIADEAKKAVIEPKRPSKK